MKIEIENIKIKILCIVNVQTNHKLWNQLVEYTHPNSLKDSNANLKVKTTKEKGVWVHSLV
jgi:hypothetical protein